VPLAFFKKKKLQCCKVLQRGVRKDNGTYLVHFSPVRSSKLNSHSNDLLVLLLLVGLGFELSASPLQTRHWQNRYSTA
jgi:hypothetical protein